MLIKKSITIIFVLTAVLTVSCSRTKPAAKKTAAIVKQRGPLFMFKLGPILTKTADEEDPQSISIRLYLAFINPTPALHSELNARSFQLKDCVRVFYHSKKTSEMTSMAQILKLKKILKLRLNKILINGKIVKLVFSELTIK